MAHEKERKVRKTRDRKDRKSQKKETKKEVKHETRNKKIKRKGKKKKREKEYRISNLKSPISPCSNKKVFWILIKLFILRLTPTTLLSLFNWALWEANANEYQLLKSNFWGNINYGSLYVVAQHTWH